ncbi:MAG: hypothetical protein M1834_009354 [Cirrosporium novae-zelandiae]|nr:MAG: hypothetical protein M1834_009354 [Cirrosporium novae-zelandiae]
MAGYVSVSSRSGRLEYIPEDRSDDTSTTPSTFLARSPRPHILRVANVGAELGAPYQKSKKSSRSKKLAGHRENAKKLLRLVASSRTPSTPSSSSNDLRPQSSRRPGDRPVSQGGNMVSVDGIIPRSRGGSFTNATSSRRPSLVENIRGASSSSRSRSGSRTEHGIPLSNEKPVASGNGIAVSIALTEPVLFLQGFEQSDSSHRATTMLRGALHLKITKSAKIKTISLNFRGKAETEWPEGIPPRKTEFRDTESIMNHTWPFFNAQFPLAETSHGADHMQLAKAPSTSTKEIGVTDASVFDIFSHNSSPINNNLSSRDAKRLSLQISQARSFGKGDSAHGGPTVAQKGYKLFHPGDYIYNFELPLDSRIPETINVELGSVRYELEATVERAGAFRANLVGSKEVLLIRAPSEGSLEQVEPIAISRSWEDQLHYEIVISGKSFPLGAQIPIAFKLTPLAKVQCHRIKVYVTENIQYFTHNKRVHRLEPTRKIQLFEKRADAPSTSTYPGSSLRITAGGGVSYDSREAAARGEENVERNTTNLLGDLENEHSIGPTEMEFNVQLPSCHGMKDKDKTQKIHFDTTFQNIQVHHWIKIVMRLSKPDAIDSSKRRHFEISIDSPFHILSCRATQANTSLPAYSSCNGAGNPLATDEFECGCPGAAVRRRNSGLSNLISGDNSNSSLPDCSATSVSMPAPAHIQSSSANFPDPNRLHPDDAARPIHLLRSPSFSPPDFSDASTDPPPPLQTPPPEYESIANPGGLADYFSRLADEMGDEEDEGLEMGMRRRNRSLVDVPLTPGGRVYRSMDEPRAWLPVGR